jgi:hypothetical protein
MSCHVPVVVMRAAVVGDEPQKRPVVGVRWSSARDDAGRQAGKEGS